MNSIRTLVVDDEPLALDLVADYVAQVPYLELVGRCTNAKDAYERISQGDIQLVFCDIQMHGMSGITLMKSVQSSNRDTKVIFTTAFPEYALDGFKLDAVDYLLKPFDFDEFMKAAGKAKRLIDLELGAAAAQSQNNGEPVEGKDYFFVKSEYKLVRIDKKKITYIEGLKDYIKINLDGEAKPVLTLLSLKEMMNKLDEPNFVRVHRSFIINVAFIRGVERNNITTHTGDKIPIGDQYKSQFNDIINQKTI